MMRTRPTCSTTKSVDGSSGRHAMSTGSAIDPTIGSSESRGGPPPVELPLETAVGDGSGSDADGEGDAAPEGLAEDGVSDGVGPHARTTSAKARTTPIERPRISGC
jgi:hypothetical protein